MALTLLPFAGIAFLWFIGVVRDRLGEHEDRLFATVFLGSGLLFLAMLFASAALAGGILVAYGAAPSALLDSETYAFARAATFVIINTYAIKMAGVFMITTATLFLRTKVTPRWMALLGYALALLLLVTISRLSGIILVFPLWILLISIYILIENYRRGPDTAVSGADTRCRADTAVGRCRDVCSGEAGGSALSTMPSAKPYQEANNDRSTSQTRTLHQTPGARRRAGLAQRPGHFCLHGPRPCGHGCDLGASCTGAGYGHAPVHRPDLLYRRLAGRAAGEALRRSQRHLCRTDAGIRQDRALQLSPRAGDRDHRLRVAHRRRESWPRSAAGGRLRRHGHADGRQAQAR